MADKDKKNDEKPKDPDGGKEKPKLPPDRTGSKSEDPKGWKIR